MKSSMQSRCKIREDTLSMISEQQIISSLDRNRTTWVLKANVIIVDVKTFAYNM